MSRGENDEEAKSNREKFCLFFYNNNTRKSASNPIHLKKNKG